MAEEWSSAFDTVPKQVSGGADGCSFRPLGDASALTFSVILSKSEHRFNKKVDCMFLFRLL